jgi:hypothetical protein
MADQVIQGTLDVEATTQPAPFDAFKVNILAGIAPVAVLEQSNFFVIRETSPDRLTVGGPRTPPPPPVDIFSVRASDGVVTTKSIETQGTIEIAGPSSAKPFNVLTVDATSFVVPENLSQSYFIIARDIDAAPPNGAVRFSVRADGMLSAGTIQSPTVDQIQQQIDALRPQLAALGAQINGLSAQLNDGLGALQGQIVELQGDINELNGEVSGLEARI